MAGNLIPIILLLAAGSGFLYIIFLLFGSNEKQQFKNLSASASRSRGEPGEDEFLQAARKLEKRERKGVGLSLKKKLKYGLWTRVTPPMFYLAMFVISTLCFLLARPFLSGFLQIAIFVSSGPILMNFLLNRAVDKRFMAFDRDYPQMLNSLVGLIKTGLNTTQALKSAAEGMEEGSLVKSEVESMIERMRFGVSEDKSIGAFGDDVFHPEIELFVQALLLNRRVGGNLSDTLERLAKQVRKRQQFRASAKAAVGLQRGSIWFILAILVGLELYLLAVYPESVYGALEDEFGWLVWQAGLFLIGVGMYWVNQVTKIKI